MKDAQMYSDVILSLIQRNGCILMMDFDGTLAPIVANPKAVRMKAGTRRTLATIAHGVPTAIITGRALSDIYARISMRNIAFAGNHGFEWRIRGKSYRASIPSFVQRACDDMRNRVHALAQTYQGSYFEEKGPTFSLHFRRVPRSRHASLKVEMKKAARAAGSVRLVEGVYVINVLPAVHLDKGIAAKRMYRILARGKRPVPIFIGDDLTDEDAFRAFPRGITIRVGKSSSSAARYYFKSRTGVDKFLRIMRDAHGTRRFGRLKGSQTD